MSKMKTIPIRQGIIWNENFWARKPNEKNVVNGIKLKTSFFNNLNIESTNNDNVEKKMKIKIFVYK